MYQKGDVLTLIGVDPLGVNEEWGVFLNHANEQRGKPTEDIAPFVHLIEGRRSTLAKRAKVDEPLQGQQKLQLNQKQRNLDRDRQKLRADQELLRQGQRQLQLDQKQLKLDQHRLKQDQELLMLGQQQLQLDQEQLKLDQQRLKQDQEELQEHRRSDQHGDEPEEARSTDAAEKSLHNCNLCKQDFASAKAVYQHKQTNHGDYKCDLRTKTYVSAQALSRHKKTEHSDFSVSCPVCKQVFIQKDNMKRHIKNVHKVE